MIPNRIASLFFLFLIPTEIITEPIDYNIRGFVAPGWEFIRDLFRENFVQQRELGASVAIYHQGRLVLELAGGWFDHTQTKPYDKETLQLVFSTTKGLVAGAVALAVQRGLLDYSALVTRYWPEYGQNGKENTTVADILSHRAGLPDITENFDDYLNWTTMVHQLEQMVPLWPPGSAHGYHPLSYGWLAGELIRRVDPKKRSLGQFIQEEMANKNLFDFFIGLSPEQDHRVSPLEFSKDLLSAYNISDNDNLYRYNDHRTHRAEIPGGNGIATASAIARFYAGLIGDLDDGKYKRMLNEETLNLAVSSNTPKNEIDLVVKVPTSFAMGFLAYEDTYPEFGSKSFGHEGFGGSIGFCAPSKNVSFAYTVNRLDVPSANEQRIGSILKKVAEYLNR